FVKNPVMARALGKAFFWDMQVGSDGVQACASCHFRAGADPRSKNQVSPGLRHATEPDLSYTTGPSPNYQRQASDFPLTRLKIPPQIDIDFPGVRGELDPDTDSNDAISSQGVRHRDGVDPQGFFVELQNTDLTKPDLANTRRVEPRNTPSVINAV